MTCTRFLHQVYKSKYALKHTLRTVNSAGFNSHLSNFQFNSLAFHTSSAGTFRKDEDNEQFYPDHSDDQYDLKPSRRAQNRITQPTFPTKHTGSPREAPSAKDNVEYHDIHDSMRSDFLDADLLQIEKMDIPGTKRYKTERGPKSEQQPRIKSSRKGYLDPEMFTEASGSEEVDFKRRPDRYGTSQRYNSEGEFSMNAGENNRNRSRYLNPHIEPTGPAFTERRFDRRQFPPRNPSDYKYSGNWRKTENRIDLRHEVLGEVLFGVFPVFLALQQKRRELHKLFMKPSVWHSGNKHIQEILRLAEQYGINIKETSSSKLKALSKTESHQGICMDVSKISTKPYEQNGDLDTDKADEDEHDTHQLWILLDSIQDPMNFGAILRSAFYLGVNKVFTVDKNSCSLSPTVSKASSGILEVLPIYSLRDHAHFIKVKQSEGWCILGTVSPHHPQARPLQDISINKNTLLLLGNEGRGISTEILELCNQLVAITPQRPLVPGVDSLNVSVATGILLHHISSLRNL